MARKRTQSRTGDVAPGLWRGLADHPLRPQLVGEVHARPFLGIETPRRIVHYAFLTGETGAAEDRKRITDLARSRGLDEPREAKFVRLELGKVRLRWEQHTEFTSYTLDTGVDATEPFRQADFADVLPGVELTAPGPLIAATQVALVAAGDGDALIERLFDPGSLCVIEVEQADARVASDFSADPGGMTRILIEDRGLGAQRAGVLVQRLIELETYRLLALMALPEAQKLQPLVRRVESDLADIMARMREAGFEDNRLLLDRMTTLASDLEAHAAATSHRFGASRAYGDIVDQRLKAIGEKPVSGYRSWESFLRRRMGPALQTCRFVEERLTALAVRLSRAANLLRTRVDIELEQQNRSLLESMNRRAKLQLRLQQTVEGLSVAAVSYYVVGLIGYLVGGVEGAGVAVPEGLVEAAAVPVVVLAVWWMVRRVRRAYADRTR
ncbi:MAG TPA: DUF3422 domain-containing protein [Hyphomicrobiales bacterium]|nr:DUF3422 domain-containing protein [Hyphomicrobiales bacterium]